jgi:hypothetical protein
MPTWQESVDLEAIGQDRFQLTAEQDLSNDLAGLLWDLEAKENAVKEILELASARGDFDLANQKLAKFAEKRAVLEKRILNNKGRMETLRARIDRAVRAHGQENLERATKIQRLFARVG